MNAKQHLNFAIYSTLTLTTGYIIGKNIESIELNDVIIVCVGVGVGSLLPDIDHPKSIMGHIIPLHYLHKLCSNWKWYKKSNRIWKHGGITHTILINTWIFILGYYIESLLIAGIGIGYMTHLYADHVTGNKLPMVWWPINKRRK